MERFWFDLAVNAINGFIRLTLRLIPGKEAAEKAYRPVVKTLIVLTIVFVLGLATGVVYLAAR